MATGEFDYLTHAGRMDQWCPQQPGRCFDVRCDACPNRTGWYPVHFVTNTPRVGESPEQTKARYREKSDPVTDAVTLPNHYARFAIEPVRFITENKLDFFQGNIVKYVCRHDAKNGREDLKKAARYLEMYIKYLDGDPDFWKKA